MHKFMLLVAVFLSLASFAFAADTELFTITSLPPNRAEEMTTVAWGPTLKSVTQVQFNFGVLQNNVAEEMSIQTKGYRRAEGFAGEVTFQVEGIFYTAVLNHVELRGGSSYSWFGYVNGSPFLSHFAIVNGMVAGEIWLPTSASTGFHRSIVSRDGEQYLVQWNEQEIARRLAYDQVSNVFTLPEKEDEAQGVSVARTVRRHLEPASCGMGQVLAQQLNLVIVYDTTALSRAGSLASLQADIQVGVDRANATIVNSGVGGNFHVNLVDMEAWPGYTSATVSGGSMSDDLEAVGTSSWVAGLKQKYHAQVVSLWVGHDDGTCVGIAAMPGNHDDSLAYNVVEVGVGTEIFCHEFGHNIGMSHQWQIVPTPWAQFAADNAVDGYWRCAVSTGFSLDTSCPHGCATIIPVFPNPSVQVDGVPTGIPDIAENWRMIGVGFPMLGATSSCVAQ